MITSDNKTKCDWCGRFIKPKDIAWMKFTPDTPFTVEREEYKCSGCHENKD